MRAVRKMRTTVVPILLGALVSSQQAQAFDLFSAAVGGGVTYLLLHQENSHSHVSYWNRSRPVQEGRISVPVNPTIASYPISNTPNRLAVRAYPGRRGIILCGADGICLK